MDWYTRTHTVFTSAIQASVQTFFSKLYIDRWSQPDVAAAMRRMPSVMMWDDHDLMDGWGSYPSDLHESPVFQGIVRVAKAVFELFQRQMMGAPAPATLPDQPGHTSGYRMGPACWCLTCAANAGRAPVPRPLPAACWRPNASWVRKAGAPPTSGWTRNKPQAT